MRPDPVRLRWQQSAGERLEARLALAADIEYDFYAGAASMSLEQQAAAFTTLAASVHQATGVAAAKANYGFTGSGQTVAVIDTGIAWDHYALGRGLGANYRVVGGWDFSEENDANPYDDGPAGFHGTHVAGIIGSSDAKNSGVATGVDFVGLRVFNDQGAGKFEWVEQALRWVYDHRFDFENPITTVNLSLGAKWNAQTLPNWATLEDELKQLYDAGIFVSVAAGNDFASYNAPGLAYPAVSPYVVAVGSVTSAGVFSTFSQRSDRILAAPGQSITSTVPDWLYGGNGIPNDFGTVSGTSMAAPYVAGAAVLVREAMQFAGWTKINQDIIYQHLRNTADVFYDAATKANYYRIHVGRAIDAIIGDDYGGDITGGKQLGVLHDDFTVAGVIGRRDDRDNFTFTAGASGTIALTVAARDQLSPFVQIAGASLQEAQGAYSFQVVAGQQYSVQLSTKAGIGHYDLRFEFTAATPAAPNITAWGEVHDAQFTGEKIDGETWYQLTAGRTGILTLEAKLTAGGSAKLELLTAQQQVVAQAPAASHYGRVDLNVSAGETILVRVTGAATTADFRVVNLVTHSGSTVTVAGTAGNDAFAFTAGARPQVSVNGLSYAFDASRAASFQFQGDAGVDSVRLVGTAHSDTATFTQAGTTLSGFGYRAVATGVENIALVGGGGHDRLELQGTAGEDTLALAVRSVTFLAGGAALGAIGFSTVTVDGSGGSDSAQLTDSAGNDRFTAAPGSATLVGAGFNHTLRGFETIAVLASAGNDAATFYDSAGDDIFSADPTHSTLRGAGYAFTVTGFDSVAAFASAGWDTAQLLDSAGDDRFYGRSTTAWLTGSGFYNSASGFDRVTATAQGGVDTAFLYDSAGNDLLLAGPTATTLRGAGFDNQVAAFERVLAYATSGNDEARFFDSLGDDTFTSSPFASTMRGDGYSNTATNFKQISATATSGVDHALFADLGAGDDVLGEADMAAVTRARLTELIVGFDFVTAKASGKGARAALLAVDYLFGQEGNW